MEFWSASTKTLPQERLNLATNTRQRLTAWNLVHSKRSSNYSDFLAGVLRNGVLRIAVSGSGPRKRGATILWRTGRVTFAERFNDGASSMITRMIIVVVMIIGRNVPGRWRFRCRHRCTPSPQCWRSALTSKHRHRIDRKLPSYPFCCARRLDFAICGEAPRQDEYSTNCKKSSRTFSWTRVPRPENFSFGASSRGFLRFFRSLRFRQAMLAVCHFFPVSVF